MSGNWRPLAASLARPIFVSSTMLQAAGAVCENSSGAAVGSTIARIAADPAGH